jgi:hypothetical protein
MKTRLLFSRVQAAGAIALALCLAAPAGAQETPPAASRNLMVSCDKGRMTIVAQSVSLRTIIQEWARVGGVRLVNPQYVSATPVSVDLRDLPERAALKVLLRSLPGYLLQQRSAESGLASGFEKLVVMAPVSTARLALSATTSLEFPDSMAGSSNVRAGRPDQPTADPAEDPSSPPPGMAPSADGAFVQPRAASSTAAPMSQTAPTAIPGQPRPGLPAPGFALPAKDARSERR